MITVTPLDERDQWTLKPLISVGPVVFGMTLKDVGAALGYPAEQIGYSEWNSMQLRGHREPLNEAYFSDPAVDLYFDSDRLQAVAVDALHGPRIIVDGFNLTGRAPKDVEDWFSSRADDAGYLVNQEGHPADRSLGVIVRTQRCNGERFTRPVMVSEEWSENVGDTSLSIIAPREWHVR